MNLYDYVVNFYQEALLILQRVEDDVRVETFSYQDVQCLRYEEVLLRGNLHLIMPERVFDLPFNTVSTVIMLRLLTLIRQRKRRSEHTNWGDCAGSCGALWISGCWNRFI
jgi:hypothetical protein